jgi:hypothetical protein
VVIKSGNTKPNQEYIIVPNPRNRGINPEVWTRTLIRRIASQLMEPNQLQLPNSQIIKIGGKHYQILEDCSPNKQMSLPTPSGLKAPLEYRHEGFNQRKLRAPEGQ